MSDRTTLGDRMKRYEQVNQSYLTIRTPAIIRVDGRAFHSYANKFIDLVNDVGPTAANYSFSPHLTQAMVNTAKFLVENIQGAQFAYTQSDEISILVRDYMSLESQPWFDYNVNKVTSLSASIATIAFNRWVDIFKNPSSVLAFEEYAQFDARAFSLPREEVTNYFIWRQQDAIRNAINKCARTFFSQKQMHELSTTQVIDKLSKEKLFEYEVEVADCFRKGSCAFRPPQGGPVITDMAPPVFTQNRLYVEKFIHVIDDE